MNTNYKDVKGGGRGSLSRDTVQLWSPDIMLTANLPVEEAREMVKNGKCYVITGQAVGLIRGNKRKRLEKLWEKKHGTKAGFNQWFSNDSTKLGGTT